MRGSVASVGRVRGLVIGGLFIVAGVSFLDRNNIAVAASFVQKNFHLTNIQLGKVFSWNASFAVASGLCVVGGVAWLLINPAATLPTERGQLARQRAGSIDRFTEAAHV